MRKLESVSSRRSWFALWTGGVPLLAGLVAWGFSGRGAAFPFLLASSVAFLLNWINDRLSGGSFNTFDNAEK